MARRLFGYLIEVTIDIPPTHGRYARCVLRAALDWTAHSRHQRIIGWEHRTVDGRCASFVSHGRHRATDKQPALPNRRQRDCSVYMHVLPSLWTDEARRFRADP